MKKIIIFLTIFLISSCSFNLFNKNKQEEQQKIKQKQNITKKSEVNNKKIFFNKTNKNNDNSIKNKQKIFLEKWLLINWTIHLKNEEYILALRNFLKAYKINKSDWIKKQIADTYFLMKKWNDAYKYYSEIKNKNLVYKQNYLKSFLYSLNIVKLKNNKKYLSWAIENIKKMKLLNTEEKFFYSNSLTCIKDFSLCKKNFEDYLKKHKNIKSKQLLDIKQALQNYKDFKIDELYFKNALILWALFKNELYPIVIIIWEDILKEKKDYQPIIKMIAQSFFELWDYKNAKKYLTKYYALDSNDKNILYLLSIIAQKNHDYVLSNIYLTKAEKLWYNPITNIYRLKIYNAYILDDSNKLIENFDKLIKSEKKPQYEDLVLATYYNIINWNNTKAWEYANKWIKLYPNKEDFYWFKAWILIEENKLDEAKKLLEKWYNINRKNALINLTLWILKEKNNKKIEAMLYYKRALKLDNWWDISKIALKKIQNLKENKTNSWTTN